MSRTPKNAPDIYLGVVDRLEPDICCIDRDAALASIAISLKRIADNTDKIISFADPDFEGEDNGHQGS